MPSVLGGPGSGNKVWETLNREISESGKNRGQIVPHREFQSTAAFHDRKNRCDLRSCTRPQAVPWSVPLRSVSESHPVAVVIVADAEHGAPPRSIRGSGPAPLSIG